MSAPYDLRRVKSEHEQDLLSRKGVTGVGIGPKITKGKKTDQVSIRIYVKEKKPKSKLTKGELIPETIDGVPTDVIERNFVLHPGLSMKVDELQIHADTGTYNPLVGGISIGPCRTIGGSIYGGTLGCIVEDNGTGDKMLLSNFHVMCVDNTWSAGDTMAQPARIDTGSCPSDIVGALERASLGGQVDCAVASITARNHQCRIEDIGNVAGTALPVQNEPVRKRGRTTGLTHGFVDDLSLSVQIDYGPGIGLVTLTNQIGLEVDTAQSTEFGNSGDSGSVVVNASREVIGLYFAGTPDGTYGVANPIDAVLSALNVSICTPSVFPTSVWDDLPTLSWLDTSPWADFVGTRPWLDQWGTPNKAFDDVKTSFYDTLIETIQEHLGNTLQEHHTLQEGIPFDPGDPVRRPPGMPGGGFGGATPFALATPHHARAAEQYEAGAGGGGGADVEAQIRHVEAVLRDLKRQRG